MITFPSVHRVLAAALVLAVSPLAMAQAPSPSVPSTAFPTLPDVESIAVHIVDLETAPPVAQAAILQLAALGAYPLTAEMEALPNAPLDVRTAAYMLVNVFAPERAQEFPVPADAASAILANASGTTLVTDAILSAGGLRDLLLALLELPAEQEAQLALVVNERYPALQAGNPDTPMTRAGAALMLTIALRYLTLPPV